MEERNCPYLFSCDFCRWCTFVKVAWSLKSIPEPTLFLEVPNLDRCDIVCEDCRFCLKCDEKPIDLANELEGSSEEDECSSENLLRRSPRKRVELSSFLCKKNMGRSFQLYNSLSLVLNKEDICLLGTTENGDCILDCVVQVFNCPEWQLFTREQRRDNLRLQTENEMLSNPAVLENLYAEFATYAGVFPVSLQEEYASHGVSLFEATCLAQFKKVYQANFKRKRFYFETASIVYLQMVLKKKDVFLEICYTKPTVAMLKGDTIYVTNLQKFSGHDQTVSPHYVVWALQ